MRLFIASESYGSSPDGSAVFERRLALALEDLGHEVTVWAPMENPSSDPKYDGVRVNRQRSVPTFVDRHRLALATVSQAKRLIAATRPDCLHINGPAMIGRSAIAAARQMGIPTVGTNHLMPQNLLFNVFRGDATAAHRMIWRYLARFYDDCDHITAPTETAKEFLLRAGLSSPTTVISNGVDTNTFSPDDGPPNAAVSCGITAFSGVTLMYLGRVNREKRLDILIRALPSVLQHVPVRLLILGTGNAQGEVVELVRRLGLSKCVSLLGHVREEDKSHFLRLATIFVMPSPSELQSIATLEAMACGLPIIAADAGALPEVCKNDINGRMFSSGNHESLAREIVSLCKTPKSLESMRTSSRAIAVRDHSHHSTVHKYLEIYERLMGRSKNASVS